MQENVDHVEIDKFSQMAHKWWDLDGEFKPLHQINPLRTGYIDHHAPLAGTRVIDVAAVAASCPKRWPGPEPASPASILRKNR